MLKISMLHMRNEFEYAIYIDFSRKTPSPELYLKLVPINLRSVLQFSIFFLRVWLNLMK